MDKNTQQPVAWMLECPTMTGDTGWKLSWNQSGAGVCNRLAGEDHEKALYTAPPVPRDVLMALAAEVRDATYDAVRESGLYPAGSDLPDIDIAAIAYRYASQVRPERCQCCGYLVTESEHKGCLRAGRAANAPEPVNQQMLRTLHHIEGAAKDIRVERHHIASAARAAIDAAMQK